MKNRVSKRTIPKANKYMKIYDISQEIFSCSVYPGDESPKIKEVCRMSRGETYNLTSFSMCAHNGTHVDAPFHFFENGKTVDKIELEKTLGYCTVTAFDGTMGAEDAENILKSAQNAAYDSEKRILFKGNAVITPEAAKVFSRANIYLIGVESQSVGDINAPMAVHKVLLDRETVLLEGICLESVENGVYFLCAQPLSLGGSDGAPCRAVLIKF